MTLIDTVPRARTKADPDYLALVERFPLRAIASDRQLAEAIAVVDKLAGFELTSGQAQYLDALATLIEKYESEHVPRLPASSPHELLAALMENRGTTRKQFIKLIGSESAASMLLKGTRGPSKRQAKLLARFFRVDAGVFL